MRVELGVWGEAVEAGSRMFDGVDSVSSGMTIMSSPMIGLICSVASAICHILTVTKDRIYLADGGRDRRSRPDAG